MFNVKPFAFKETSCLKAIIQNAGWHKIDFSVYCPDPNRSNLFLNGNHLCILRFDRDWNTCNVWKRWQIKAGWQTLGKSKCLIKLIEFF